MNADPIAPKALTTQDGVHCPACGSRLRFVARAWCDFEGIHRTDEGECPGCHRTYPEAVVDSLLSLVR
jgi:RNA polymerase subunit RPABC4/transcription elongation factor Spt4